jgi:FKBP-type peptidyl-prolyl cis-trans isomerase FklB
MIDWLPPNFTIPVLHSSTIKRLHNYAITKFNNFYTMKKNILLLLSIALMAGSVSCSGGSKVPSDVSLKNQEDSLSYAFGRLNARDMNKYLAAQYKLDTLTALDSFIEGFASSMQDTSAQAKAYRAGVALGDELSNQVQGLEAFFFAGDSTRKVNKDALILAFAQAVKGVDTKMTQEEAEVVFTEARTKAMEKQFGPTKAAGEAYLMQNKAKEGVTTLPSGLQYRVITAGNGATPTAEQVVKVNYVGKLIDGTEFDKSQAPFEIDMKAPQVIPGWIEVLKLMPVGSKWEVVIPQELAYGAQGAQNQYGQYSIEPFSTLVFEIEMLEAK